MQLGAERALNQLQVVPFLLVLFYQYFTCGLYIVHVQKIILNNTGPWFGFKACQFFIPGKNTVMYGVLLLAVIVAHPGCFAIGYNVVMEFEIGAVGTCGGPNSAFVAAVNKTITHSIVPAVFPISLPKNYGVFTVVKNAVVNYQPMSVCNHTYVQRQHIGVAAKQALGNQQVV